MCFVVLYFVIIEVCILIGVLFQTRQRAVQHFERFEATTHGGAMSNRAGAPWRWPMLTC
jgi:hypothetical protein